MNRLAVIPAVLLMASAVPALAADAKVEAALKAFAAVETDAGKQKTFCAMTKAMNSASDEEKDPAKTEALDKEIQGHMAALGDEF